MKDSMFWIAVAQDNRRHTRAGRARCNRRAGRRPAPDHPVLDVLLGALVLLVLLAVAVPR